MNELLQLYQQMILDHGRNPRNFGSIEKPTHKQKGVNPMCGDDLEMCLIIDENETIVDVKFTGHGCAISIASASILSEMVIGKTILEANQLFNDFHAMIVSQDISDEAKKRLGKATILEGVKNFPSRIKCATLSWHALKNACDGKGQATTE